MTLSSLLHLRRFLSPVLETRGPGRSVRPAGLGQAAALLAAVTGAGLGCAAKDKSLADPDAQQLVGLLMPERIRIVEAFTTFKSFDEDNIPDGIALMVQPVDFYGDPVKIAGTVRAELYTYIPASAMHEGSPVCDPWRITIASEDDQRKYWNVVTSMYEFPLELPAGLSPSGAKYVLKVVYTTPLDTFLDDELVVALPQLPAPVVAEPTS